VVDEGFAVTEPVDGPSKFAPMVSPSSGTSETPPA
jgi:hypothetical protein